MGIINNAVYLDGAPVARPPTLQQTYEMMAETGGMGWIGLYRPRPAEVASLAREFSLHDLVVEDTIKAHQRPKIERYDDILFTVLRPAHYVTEQESVEFGELHIIIGPRFVITTRYAEAPDLSVVRRRLESSPALLARGPETVLYAILDQVVDEYEPVADGLDNDIDEIEIEVFSGRTGVSLRVYTLLREVIEFQRATKPLLPILDSLKDGVDRVHLDDEHHHRLRDVEDHVLKIIDRIDGYRSLLESILTVNTTLVAQRQNEEIQRLAEAQFTQSEDMKKISSWAAILFAPTVVAGVYGMNFDRMPEVHWVVGYPFALLLMLTVPVTLFAIFKRRGWI